MFKGQHSEFWNYNDPECNDDFYYEDTIARFGDQSLSFELGQRSILHVLSTFSVEEMLTCSNKNIQQLGMLLKVNQVID